MPIRKLKAGGTSPTLTGNATVADVVAGKTFYSTDSATKLTGTYNPEKTITPLTLTIPAAPTISVSTAVAAI